MRKGYPRSREANKAASLALELATHGTGTCTCTLHGRWHLTGIELFRGFFFTHSDCTVQIQADAVPSCHFVPMPVRPVRSGVLEGVNPSPSRQESVGISNRTVCVAVRDSDPVQPSLVVFALLCISSPKIRPPVRPHPPPAYSTCCCTYSTIPILATSHLRPSAATVINSTTPDAYEEPLIGGYQAILTMLSKYVPPPPKSLSSQRVSGDPPPSIIHHPSPQFTHSTHFIPMAFN